MKYIDSHGHLNSKEFQDNIEDFLLKAKENNVEKIIVPGTSKEDSLLSIELAKKHKNLFSIIAIHPSDSKTKESADWLNDIDPKDIIGIGETGIDLYWENNPSLEIQEHVFKKHLDYAKKHDLPVAIHMRNAEEHIYRIMSLDEYKSLKFIIHCSTTTPEWNLKFVELGAYISFSGIVTFKNAHDVRESAMKVPLDRILCETDAPYLTPVPFRGKLNQPAFVKHVVDFIAKERPEDETLVREQIYNNTVKIFNLKKYD